MKKQKILPKVIYMGLGFPVKLLNVPVKEMFGEEVYDINLNTLQIVVLDLLAHKQAPLTGKELCFIRKYYEMTCTSFGSLFGVTHAAVLKWENEKCRITPSTELCIRLFILDRLHANDREFRILFHEVSVQQLAEYTKDNHIPIEINASKKLLAA